MKKRTIVFLIFGMLIFSGGQLSAQTGFTDFWTKFKSAVKAKDKSAVAALTSFPLPMSYGIPDVKNKAQMTRRFAEVFDGEADAAKCFSREKPERESPTHYSIACGFKRNGEGAGKPIVYSFARTKTGWKFVGLDNINE
jgi:hypothetical protein